jgi:hypothetical protein
MDPCTPKKERKHDIECFLFLKTQVVRGNYNSFYDKDLLGNSTQKIVQNREKKQRKIVGHVIFFMENDQYSRKVTENMELLHMNKNSK